MSTSQDIKIIKRGQEQHPQGSFGRIVIVALIIGAGFWAYQKWWAKKDPSSRACERESTEYPTPQNGRGSDGLFVIPSPF